MIMTLIPSQRRALLAVIHSRHYQAVRGHTTGTNTNGTIWQQPKALAIGGLAGALGSLAGMGGGFVMIPLMTSPFLLKLSPFFCFFCNLIVSFFINLKFLYDPCFDTIYNLYSFPLIKAIPYNKFSLYISRTESK